MQQIEKAESSFKEDTDDSIQFPAQDDDFGESTSSTLFNIVLSFHIPKACECNRALTLFCVCYTLICLFVCLFGWVGSFEVCL